MIMITSFKNISLKSFNTFGIDLTAERMLILQSEEDIQNLSSYDFKNHKIFIIGGGSNLLFTRDYDEIIIKINNKGFEIVEETEGYSIVNAAAGEEWNDLVNFCIENELYGIENLTLIPGTVGAAPVQNIGAYGVEFKDVFHSLEGYDFHKEEKVELFENDCKFGYRDSIFKRELKNEFLITRVNIKLSRQKKFNLTYRSLNEAFSKYSQEEITIRIVSDTVKKIRESKLPDFRTLGNAGSFFKNPEIDSVKYENLRKDYPQIVSFPGMNDRIKISAGWLIEACGLKGRRVENVGTHKDQALVIVNYGNATGLEILNFANLIREKIHSQFGIELEYEVNIIL